MAGMCRLGGLHGDIYINQNQEGRLTPEVPEVCLRAGPGEG
jgi:hypothetical protein